jgi:DNA-binding Lrp family transcriptional regulator
MTDEKRTNNNRIKYRLDNLDYRIISLMVLGLDNKKISSILKIPFSTLQRRTKRILETNVVNIEYVPNFKILDIKTSLLYIYVRHSQIHHIAEKIADLDGILSCSIHIGNSDIVSEFIHSENSEDLVEIIGAIEQIDGVEKVLWSEQVLKLPKHPEHLMKSFKKFWDNNNTSK